MGQCSSLGVGVQAFWTALISSKSGLRQLDIDNRVGKGLGGRLSIPDSLSLEDRLGWALRRTIHEANEDAHLTTREERQNIDVVAASNFGDHYGVLEHGDFFHPLRKIIAEFCLGGEFWGISTACASGGGALGLAADLIKHEGREKVLVCAFDVITSYNYHGLASLRAISLDTIRPFDKNRAGTLLGEAVAALVLESESSVSSRGVKVYGEFLGYGISNDAYHYTAPEPSGIGMRTAMSQALQESNVPASGIDHLNAHGTGTHHNDLIETKAVRDAFGDAAESLPITSIKAAIGHTMGAAGALEGIATVLSLRDKTVPPTLNFNERDPECNLDYVFNTPRHVSMHSAMSNSYGLWGCNVSVIFGRVDGQRVEKYLPKKEQL